MSYKERLIDNENSTHSFIWFNLYDWLLSPSGNVCGHGIVIFVAPLITWMLLFPVFYLLTRINKSFINRFIFVVLMLIHYAQILLFLRPLFLLEFDQNDIKAWNRDPLLIVITAIWYLVGQLMIWLVFFFPTRKQVVLKKSHKRRFIIQHFKK
jgi:hypothetical protein